MFPMDNYLFNAFKKETRIISKETAPIYMLLTLIRLYPLTSGTYVGPYQTLVMELFCENCWQLLAINYFFLQKLHHLKCLAGS